MRIPKPEVARAKLLDELSRGLWPTTEGAYNALGADDSRVFLKALGETRIAMLRSLAFLVENHLPFDKVARLLTTATQASGVFLTERLDDVTLPPSTFEKEVNKPNIQLVRDSVTSDTTTLPAGASIVSETIKTRNGSEPKSIPTLVFSDVASALAHYGEEATLASINSSVSIGLTLRNIAKKAKGSEAEVSAMLVAFKPGTSIAALLNPARAAKAAAKKLGKEKASTLASILNAIENDPELLTKLKLAAGV